MEFDALKWHIMVHFETLLQLEDMLLHGLQHGLQTHITFIRNRPPQQPV